MLLYSSSTYHGRSYITIWDDLMRINGVGDTEFYLSREDVRAMIDWVNGKLDVVDEDVENSLVKNSEISK